MHLGGLIHAQDNPNNYTVFKWHTPDEPHTQMLKMLTCQATALTFTTPLPFLPLPQEHLQHAASQPPNHSRG